MMLYSLRPVKFHGMVRILILAGCVLFMSSCKGVDENVVADNNMASTKIADGQKAETPGESDNFIISMLKYEKKLPGIVFARVGEKEITTAALIKALQSGKRDDSEKTRPELKKEALELLIDKEAMLIAALNKGLDKDKEMITKAKERLRDLAINWMFKNQITDKITVSDEEVTRRLSAENKNNESAEKVKQKIYRKIFNEKKKSLDDTWTSQCHKDANVSFNQENLEFFTKKWGQAKAAARQNSPRFPFIRNKDAFNLTDPEKNKVIAVFNGGEITLTNVAEELNDIMPPKRPAPSISAAKKLAEYALTRPVLGQKAFKENWHNAIEVKEALADWVKGKLIAKIQSVEVWDKIKDLNITEENKKSFYEKNKEKYKRKDKEGNENITPYEKIKDSLEFEMQETISQETMENWKKALRNSIKIEVDNDLLDKI